jgi:hypothetical protein
MADGHIAGSLEAAPLPATAAAGMAAADATPHGEHPALDRLGIGVSLTCAVHCVASAVLGVIPALAGRIAFLEWIELPMLIVALVVGTTSLVPASRAHGHRGPLALFASGMVLLLLSRFAPEGPAELALTVSGFTPVALAHLWNLRLCHH